jgi:carboxyl-terminal processing protease
MVKTKIVVFMLFIPLFAANGNTGYAENKDSLPSHYKPYLDFLGKVYQQLKNNYYYPVPKIAYDNFVEKYKESVLEKIPPIDKRINQIAYRGAGLLVMQLRHPDDTFTNFIPPEKAKEYSKKVYGRRHDIGITGKLIKEGYLIEKVEKRSDSYKKGIRPQQLIIKIDGKDVLKINKDEIDKKLSPELGEKVKLAVKDKNKNKIVEYTIISKKYFKETIEIIPTKTPKVYCLKIESFNKKTAEDLKSYVQDFKQQGMELLILDIRENPGGPPLAIHRISGIFLPPEKKLVYYKKRNKPLFGLTSPTSKIKYDGPLVILINQKSGSSSELLAGILKEYKRAQIIGKNPTAGFSFLKGTSKFKDDSMLIMVTGFAYLFNGKKLGMEGIKPTYTAPEEIDNLLAFTIQEYNDNNLFDKNGNPTYNH